MCIFSTAMQISELLKVSRPGLWLVFIWLYLWPTGGNFKVIHEVKFWLGLVYCTFPLNLLVYGMNDTVDEDVDKANPRKGNYVYGANLSRQNLRLLPKYIAIVNVFVLVIICLCDNELTPYLIKWFACAVAINYVYNNKPFQLSRKCPFEVPAMILGHFLIPHLSCRMNSLPLPSWESWVFHSFLLSRSHIWLEYEDTLVDRAKGKKTIAVVIGDRATLTLIVVLTCMESAVGFFLLHSALLGFFSLFGILVFLWAAKTKKSEHHHKPSLFVSVSQSMVGALLMGYLWYHRILV